jgi:hypothetical protein
VGLPVAVGRSGRFFHKGGGAVAETVAQTKVYRRKGGWDGSGGDGGGGKVRIVNYLSDLYHKEVNIRRKIKRATCIGR